MKAEARTDIEQNEAQLIKVFQELMGLYSVSIKSNSKACVQDAIEFYNREMDDERQGYYLEKLGTLNEEIRGIIERSNRKQQRA